MDKTIELKESPYYITDSSSTVVGGNFVPKYTAVIQIDNWHIQLVDKTFTQEQINHMREYFGWEVKTLCE